MSKNPKLPMRYKAAATLIIVNGGLMELAGSLVMHPFDKQSNGQTQPREAFDCINIVSIRHTINKSLIQSVVASMRLRGRMVAHRCCGMHRS
jgi:hypothetical protein